MTRPLRIAGAQLDLTVGDISGNEAKILEAMSWAEAAAADVVVFPELAVCGYPPEDLVLKEGFVEANLAAVDRLARASGATAVVVGFVDRLHESRMDDDAVARSITNAAAVLAGGKIVDVYHKRLLPNYGVFDEARYFADGVGDIVLHSVGGTRCGVSICEDIWTEDGPPTVQASGGASILLNINGSPFHIGKTGERLAMLTERAVSTGSYVVYVNSVGAQDELVFDGGSMVIAPDGGLRHRSPQFVEDRFVIDIEISTIHILWDCIQPVVISCVRIKSGYGKCEIPPDVSMLTRHCSKGFCSRVSGAVSWMVHS